jgi:hypothetical protein
MIKYKLKEIQYEDSLCYNPDIHTKKKFFLPQPIIPRNINLYNKNKIESFFNIHSNNNFLFNNFEDFLERKILFLII